MSLETRIALIGIAGALAGTLAGGLITYKVTQEQISSERTESRRSERLDAYAKYFGDATRLWSQIVAITEVTPRPKNLTASQEADLDTLEKTLTGEFGLVVLVAPPRVRLVAQDLLGVNTTVWNALKTRPIDYRLYNQAKGRIYGKENLLRKFAVAVRSDLGTGEGS
jgi:hypothetical protein